jgi:hypothetical protein
MNFDQDIREHTIASLPHDLNDRPTLEAKSTSELLILYLNWRNRFIPTRPRRVHCSGMLSARAQTLDPIYRNALDCIVAAFTQGLDLNAHLSKEVKVGFQPTAPRISHRRGRRKHLDLLLNDWGIHHLHLSTDIMPDGFVRRTTPLLFAAVRTDDAYLIDILDHGRDAWTRQYVLEVMVREWPDANLALEAKGIATSAQPLTDTQRRNLRCNGYNASFVLGGKVYMPSTGGLMSTGVSIQTFMRARCILEQTKLAQSEITKRLSECRLVPRPDVDFHFAFFDDGYGFVDMLTRTAFRLA